MAKIQNDPLGRMFFFIKRLLQKQRRDGEGGAGMAQW